VAGQGHPQSSRRSDADAEIARALEALESRIEERGAKLDEIIKPLNEQLNRLEEESEALRRGHSRAESSATREIERHIARMDALRESRAGSSDEATEGDGHPAVDRPDTPPRQRPPASGHVPGLGDLRRHKLLRLAAGTGAMAMIIGSGGLGIWLWNKHEQLPLAQSAPAAVPASPGQSPDQTPPPIIAAINAPTAPDAAVAKTPAEINALRNRAQDPTRDPGHTAAYELGMALLKGKAGIASLREAGEWIATAALAGHGEAQLALGRLYASGEGYARDPQQAFFWISAAADKVRALEAKGVTVPAARTARPPAKAPEASTAPAASAALSRAEIAELQRLLASLSLDPGPADGVPGAKTIDVIRLYQQMAGLKADGVLSRKLLEQIREVAGQGGAPR
jgi:TPR repeat protein